MSGFLKVNLADLGKGLIVSILSAGLAALYAIVQAGTLPTPEQWQSIGMVALASGIAYLAKNLLSNSDGKPFTPEVKNDGSPK